MAEAGVVTIATETAESRNGRGYAGSMIGVASVYRKMEEASRTLSTVTPEPMRLQMDPVECRALLERVVNSRELKRAMRLRELLYFIGKRSLKQQPGTLREQEIGAAVFGRPEEYDTNLDNIVRVNVSELRKRLAHYFEDEGADEKIVMEIPRGGYLPVYLPRAVPEPVVEAAAVAEVPVTEAPVAEVPVVATRGWNLSALLGVLLVLALGAAGFFWWQNARLRAQLQPWKSDAVRASFWSAFFASGEDVDIVTADTSFALAEDLLGRPISLDDYLDYKYKSFADQPGLTPERREALKLVLDRNNGSIGDFQAAKRFMDLDADSPLVKLESARSYTPENIKTNNVILIGGRESNPWVDLYKDRLNFLMEYEQNGQRTYIVNRAPQAGEPAVYEVPHDRNKGLSVVAFLPNLADHRYTLIISGNDSQATRAAGEFVTSSEGLAQIRAKMPKGAFPYFEVVLSSERLVGTTLHTEIAAFRVKSRE